MTTFLSCPEIARRIGYSRMHVTRLAHEGQIPGERIITKGGQFRYPLNPQLAEWIRVMRRRPRHGKVLDSGFYILGRRASKTPQSRDTGIICEEMLGFVKEIDARMKEITLHEQQPSDEEVGRLAGAVRTCIMDLVRTHGSLARLRNQEPV
jgi:hypothetical protein